MKQYIKDILQAEVHELFEDFNTFEKFNQNKVRKFKNKEKTLEKKSREINKTKRNNGRGY